MVGRFGMLVVGLVCLAAGALALGMAHLPDHPVVARMLDALWDGSAALVAIDALGLPEDLSDRVQTALSQVPLRYGLAPAGLVLLIAGLLPGSGAGPPAEHPDGAPEEFILAIDKKTVNRARREAKTIAKSGDPLHAAELCFQNGLMDEAATYYIQADEPIRAAEIRHDQNRFVESAELYLKAGSYESAGSIFSQQEEHARAADAYAKAGNKSVAAEMYEKAEDFLHAAQCYEESEFHRHAAKAYVRCEEWTKAAECLDQVILEEMTSGGGSDARREAETRKLVRMAGDLYVRSRLPEKAEAVLERGECWAAAAEIALTRGDKEKAANLFTKAHEVPRAAEILNDLGRREESMRVLGEYHRDHDEHEKAAKCFEEAGDMTSAGDLYRVLEQYEKAGICFEKQGEYAQAAEMFGAAGDRIRAGENYENAGLHREAAECYALSGKHDREAELLAKAGDFLRAGEMYRTDNRDDDAIKALQQVDQTHEDFAKASALLGEIFRQRGMLSLAIAKLSFAVEGKELSRENIQAFYGLATVHEANDDIQAAVDLYEKILSFDYHFEDVEERLSRTRAILRSQSTPSADADSAPNFSQANGRYKITGKLGRGGMGIVYKAQDSVLDRTVALKVLPDTLKENPQALKNFLREAKSAAKLNHPNIVTVFDAGEQDGVYYIAMEYVDGHTLKEIVKHRGKISPGGIVNVLVPVSEALAYAHDQKIVHRDVKTANTMWTRDRKAKIMDFGLAKAIEEVRNHTTVVSGTPYYMSPEQTMGKNVDHRTDIYSLGVMTFELATGTLPFREGNLPYHHVHTPPPDPMELNPELPEPIACIIRRCLQKSPSDRYQSAREILVDLKEWLNV